MDEKERLFNSIKNVVSLEDAERIVTKIPLALNSTPKERGEWVENVSEILEAEYDERTIKRIREGCYCNENGKLEETARILRDLYLSVGEDMRKFVEVINQNGAGWYFEDHYLYTKYLSCPCPMLQNADISQSLTWCQCTAGYNKRMFELAFNMLVEVDVVHTIRQGHRECLLRITFAS